jgi:hypothetical protein
MDSSWRFGRTRRRQTDSHGNARGSRWRTAVAAWSESSLQRGLQSRRCRSCPCLSFEALETGLRGPGDQTFPPEVAAAASVRRYIGRCDFSRIAAPAPSATWRSQAGDVASRAKAGAGSQCIASAPRPEGGRPGRRFIASPAHGTIMAPASAALKPAATPDPPPNQHHR